MPRHCEMEGIEGSAVGALIGVLEDFIGGPNVDEPHREEDFDEDTYYRRCEGRGCPAWTKGQYFDPPAKLAAMLFASDRPVAPFLCDVCAVPCCVAHKDNVSCEEPIRHGQQVLRAATRTTLSHAWVCCSFGRQWRGPFGLEGGNGAAAALPSMWPTGKGS